MANTLPQKLRIKEGMVLRTLHAPDNFVVDLGSLPPGVNISPAARKADQVHWFVSSRTQLEKEVDDVLKIITGAMVCWVYYPKGTSKIRADLTRDKGWDKLLGHNEMQWISLISFNETWSTFGFRLKTEADKKKEGKPKVREVFKYIDVTRRTIQLPDDLEKALKQSKEAAAFFEGLSFTNKKEYVEWIVTAKREETRMARVEGSIERLEKGWKNPGNI